MKPPEPATATASADTDAALSERAERAESSARSARRFVRVETVIAILALLTSACASVAALWQSREAVVQTRATIAQTQTLADQLRASVWPYLTIDYNFTPGGVELDVINQGLGPALIRTFTYTIDRRPTQRLRDVIKFFDSHRHGLGLDSDDIGGGTVIRPSQSFRVFAITDSKFEVLSAHSRLAHTRTTICYCSLLKDCWSLDDVQTEPTMVRACGRPTHPWSLK